MFTGIIEEIGQIKDFSKFQSGAKIIVECSKVLDGAKTGDSIAINGCCGTIMILGSNLFSVYLSDETLLITNFRNLKSGMCVNLERALTPNTRMGGHIVQGHIDCIGKFLRYEKKFDFYNMTFEVVHDMCKYIVKKGSIAINGVSLTIADINDNIFNAAVIPHTYTNTTLKMLKPGDIVNIETDILGRYIEKFLSASNNKTISEDFLKENGFI